MPYSDPKTVLKRVVTVLQDASGVRWNAGELIMWLNEAMTSTATLRPDATARTVQVQLSGGEYYLLDDLLAPEFPRTLRFLRLMRNVAQGSKMGAIRVASMTAMNAILPNWRSAPANVNVLNYLTDPEDTVGFYVFPPAPGLDEQGNPPPAYAKVELMYSSVPVPIVVPFDCQSWEEAEGLLSTEMVFDTALVDYVLSRAFSKDAEFGGNGARAAAHFETYQQALGYESQGNVASKTPQKAAT